VADQPGVEHGIQVVAVRPPALAVPLQRGTRGAREIS
jgi:hypothetical protein